MDGVQRMYLKHQITAAEKANAQTNSSTTATDAVDSSVSANWLEQKVWLPLPTSVISVLQVFPLETGSSRGGEMFDIEYQMRLNDLFDFSAESIIPYYMAMERVATLEELFTGQRQVRFNRHMDKLYIDMDWENDVQEGEYIIIDCYRVVDPDTHTDVWGDRWLARYASTLIKRQWGSNVSKFEGIQLPGGQTFNAANIVSEAQEELNKLEEEMNSAYSLPVYDMTG